MPQHDHRGSGGTATQGSRAETNVEPSRAAFRPSEDVFIRNFDRRRSYDLTLKVYECGEVVFASRYHLTPGKTVSEIGRLPAGEYTIRAELDTRRERSTRCEIDETPDKTALIEVGNGTVSVTEGLYQ